MSVSVIMTCHNEERFIAQAVRSVEAQTAYDLVCEIIVVNDGSRDGSSAVLDQLSGEIEKLRVIETPGLGISAARNRALQETKGELIAILDGDDYWIPEKLARHCDTFRRSNRIGLVYGDFVDFARADAADAEIITVRRFDHKSPLHLRDYFVHDAPIMPSTAMIRHTVFDEVGMFDESLRVGEDTEFFLRVAEKWQFCHVPGAYTFKRRRTGQLTQRLDVLLPNAESLTQRFCERYPELRPLAGRRMARLYVKVSADCALRGEWRTALGHAVKALRLSPRFFRAWANLGLLLAPVMVVQPLYSFLKRPWHAIRRVGRRQRY